MKLAIHLASFVLFPCALLGDAHAQGSIALPPAAPLLPGAFAPKTVLQAAAQAIRSDPNLVASPYTLLVRFRAETSAATRASLRAMVGRGRVRAYRLVPDLELIEIRGMSVAQAVQRLAPHVLYAEPDTIVRPEETPDDPRFAEQWGLHNTGQSVSGSAGTPDADIDAPEAWNARNSATNFVIAVIDTGMDMDHPDLVENLFTNPGEIPSNGIDDDGNGFIDNIHDFNFLARDKQQDPTEEDNDPNDDRVIGHGTHVAGTIGARGDNGLGVSGVVWRCKLMPLRFMDPDGGLTSGAIAALDYAVLAGVKLSNNSWGGTGNAQAKREAVATAGASGHLFVASAGNNGVNTDTTPQFPSALDLANIISVAALDKLDALAVFNSTASSNFGATTVDLAAPGKQILATVPDNAFGFKQGTSMATPFVTGAAALVWSANPAFTAAQVKARLLQRVRLVAALNGKCVTGGTLDLRAALCPSAPTALQASLDLGGFPIPLNVTLTVRWKAGSTDQTSYEVERRIGSKSKFFKTTGRVFEDTGAGIPALSSSSSIRYRVRAVNAAGASPWSSWITLSL